MMNETDFLIALSQFSDTTLWAELRSRMQKRAEGAIVTSAKEADPHAGRTAARASETLFWIKIVDSASQRMAEAAAASKAMADEAEAEAKLHKPSPGEASTYEEPVTAD